MPFGYGWVGELLNASRNQGPGIGGQKRDKDKAKAARKARRANRKR